MNILRKLQHLDAKIIQVLELIIKKLSDEIKKINHQMSFVPFPPEQEYCEVGIPRKDINDREILQGSFRDSSSFVQEMPYMGQNLNFNAEVSGKKDPKFSKYDYTKTPI